LPGGLPRAWQQRPPQAKAAFDALKSNPEPGEAFQAVLREFETAISSTADIEPARAQLELEMRLADAALLLALEEATGKLLAAYFLFLAPSFNASHAWAERRRVAFFTLDVSRATGSGASYPTSRTDLNPRAGVPSSTSSSTSHVTWNCRSCSARSVNFDFSTTPASSKVSRTLN
jgi:hypothetical protein